MVLVLLFALMSAGARAAVIAEGNFGNTFGINNAFSIFNNTLLDISSATLTLTNGTSVWDDNLPGQPTHSFLINPGSSPTGVSHAFLDPEAGAIADFNGFYSLALSFTEFDAGEIFIFGADIDGAPITTGLLGGSLVIDLVFSDGSTGSAIYELIRDQLIRAVAEPIAALPAPMPVPMPGTWALLLLGFAGLGAFRRRVQ